jgi:RNA polymerase sigma factor (sigma-70 family)
MIGDDIELLVCFVRERSDAAFSELVGRHINLVYSAVLRQVNGDVLLAQDVTQEVFVAMARKAPSLLRHSSLTGWLYTSAHYAARQALRGEHRRRAREQEAHDMIQLHSGDDDRVWEQVGPVLDEAMHGLKTREREAVLLRFFESRSLTEVGTRLGLSEDAARMCVERALEKLRGLLAKRGVTSTASGLAAALAASAVISAPSGLAASAVSSALATTSTALPTSTILKLMSVTKLKVGAISALGIAAVTVPLVLQTRDRVRIEEQAEQVSMEQSRLEGRLAAMRAENERATTTRVDPTEVEALRTQFSAVLKLRGEVGLLRQKVHVAAVAARAVDTQNPAKPRRELEYVPRENWRDVGLQTPENAAQTILWAGREGAMERRKQAFYFGTNNPEAMRARFEEEFWKAKVTNNVAGWTHLAIDWTEATGPDEVVVHTRQTLRDGAFEPTTMKLRSIDGEWRLPYEPYDNWPFGERVIPGLDIVVHVPPELLMMPTNRPEQ